MMKTQKFAWSKDGQKSFEWRKIYHALVGGVGGMPEGGLATETLISPTAMRMYTDHRVMGAVVLPGVSHVSLMAATGSIGYPSPGGLANDWHMSVKEVLFERPTSSTPGPSSSRQSLQGPIHRRSVGRARATCRRRCCLWVCL